MGEQQLDGSRRTPVFLSRFLSDRQFSSVLYDVVERGRYWATYR
jgi:hypothetical protein